MIHSDVTEKKLTEVKKALNNDAMVINYCFVLVPIGSSCIFLNFTILNLFR